MEIFQESKSNEHKRIRCKSMCGSFVTDTDTVPLPVAELVEAPGQTMEQIRKKDIRANQLEVVEKITDK